MSKQSKNRRKIAIAKQVTANRKSGNNGSAKTKKVSKKENTRWAKLRRGEKVPGSYGN